MGTQFTGQQQQAINTLDRSVLVSAAAGSGKTAVLIERIIKIILEGKADVDEMLVVTFTKAAASEMRMKLATAIKKRMREEPADKAMLRAQLDRLYRSYISTFDSFATRVIKEFFYEIDIEPDFKACDEIQSTLMQKDAVDELFEAAFENDSLIEGGSFREFLRLYSGERSEENIKTDIIESYAKLRTMPDYWTWAYDKAENLRITRDSFDESELEKAMQADAEESLGVAYRAVMRMAELFAEADLNNVYVDKLAAEANAIADLFNAISGGKLDDDFFNAILSVSFVTLQVRKEEDKEKYLPIKEEVAELRKAYKKEIADWKNKYLVPDFDTRLREMNETYKYTVYYLNLLKEFENRYAELKKEGSQLDFADMEHTAVAILEKPEVADTLRKRFKYIFIDEYQDTNNIQEYLINRFARANNVFKVGDVKQSIYRFRQAEPAIFEDTYRKYSDGSSSSTAIDLNKNFRCNDKTIRYINTVFKDLMEGYDDKARLYTGLDKGPGYNDQYDFTPEVHVLYTDEHANEAVEILSEMADDIESISKEEAEAKYIADLVQEIIGTEFCDTKTGEIRRAEARDIAILFRSVKYRGEVLTRALRDKNIQAHIEENDDYFDTVEIGVALSLFSCIDNMKRDVQLIATLHSEVFGWTPEELAEVRIAYNNQSMRRAPYWEALGWYAENGEDELLKTKTSDAIRQIREWRKMSKEMPVEDFIWKVLVDSGYYLKVGAMYSGARRQANLRTLVDRAAKYSKNTVASLSSFLNFLEIMKTKNVSNGQVGMISKEDDVVRITTIHKSKGLEYPFVIVGGLGHRFNRENNEMKLSFDSKIGLALPYVSPDRRYWRSTPIQRAINFKSNADGYKEDLRVLYVAMTRARNKLILVGLLKDEEELLKYSARSNNYLKAIGKNIKSVHNRYYLNPVLQGDNLSKTSRIQEILKTRNKNLSAQGEEIYKDIDRKLSFEYEDKELLDSKAKYSVSELRRETVKEEVVSLWQFTDDRKKASSADMGIAYHRIMEFLDFAKICYDNTIDRAYIAERAQYLFEHSSIAEDVYNKLDMDRISEFFTSELGRRAVAAAKAGKLRKEKAFTLATEWEERDVLVQGVIDCCWEEDGEMVLVDYKSNYINPRKALDDETARIRNEYQAQIDLYSRAIAEGTGMNVGEAYLYLFAVSEAVKM